MESISKLKSGLCTRASLTKVTSAQEMFRPKRRLQLKSMAAGNPDLNMCKNRDTACGMLPSKTRH